MEELLRQRQHLLAVYNDILDYKRRYNEHGKYFSSKVDCRLMIFYVAYEAIKRFSYLNDDKSFIERVIATRKVRKAADELLRCLVLTLAEGRPGCIEFKNYWLDLDLPVDVMFGRTVVEKSQLRYFCKLES